MKTNLTLLLGILLLSTMTISAQSTAFTYQGRLSSAGAPADGLYEMQFTLFDTLTNGNVVGAPQFLAPLAVSNGLFTVQLDFGAGAFLGADRWLEITVNLFGSDMVPTTLVPRQPITSMPYALYAAKAGEYVGMGDLFAPRLNIGEGNFLNGLHATIAGGAFHENRAVAGTISGGEDNTLDASATHATISGGLANIIGVAAGSSISGGTGNQIEFNSDAGTISGGSVNRIQRDSQYATVGGGLANSIGAGAGSSTIGGGSNNFIGLDAHHSTIGGGTGNTNRREYGTISGGELNATAGFYATVGGGRRNTSSGGFATVAGGYDNSATEETATVGGGFANTAGHEAATIAGGANNTTSGDYATIGGGSGNTSSGDVATVSGGSDNRAEASSSTVAGGQRNVIPGNSPHASIGGGEQNNAGGHGATVAGGLQNTSSGTGATVGGGEGNSSADDHATVAGGFGNISTDLFATVGGGGLNRATGWGSVVAGGGGVHFEDGNEDRGNTASARWSAVLGGADNVAAGLFSTIGGGEFNRADGDYAAVPGGLDCEATGLLSFAAGWGAKALHPGSFVWADNSPTFGGPPFASTTNNQFNVRAAGGVRFFTDADATTGAELAPGSGSWSSLSDRNAKENFAATNTREILEKVASLPLASWNYRTQDTSIRHLGPTAQDFHAAFGLGGSERTITAVDADGVALAAIQGLNQKLEQALNEKDAELHALKAIVEQLKTQVQALEAKD